MIPLQLLIAVSLIAIIVDRFALDPCLGEGRPAGRETPVSKSLLSGIMVTVTLFFASLLLWMTADLVLFPLELDYLLPLAAFIAIAIIALAGDLLLSLSRQPAPAHRLSARAAAIAAVLSVPALHDKGLATLPLFQGMLVPLVTGLCFTILLVIHSSITPRGAARDRDKFHLDFSRELLVAGLILLAVQGVAALIPGAGVTP